VGNKTNRTPSQRETPASVKKPTANQPTGTNHLTPVWRFSIFDQAGPYGRCAITEEHAWSDILPKLQNFESMTWGQIEQAEKQNHSVLVKDLCSVATKRLEQLSLDDLDQLFRFRLSGKQRLWGIREANHFKILWWDPEHEVCPSSKK